MITDLQLRRDRVEHSIKNHENCELYFPEDTQKTLTAEFGTIPLEDFIENVLYWMYKKGSYSKSGRLYCGNGRKRSSIDLWRHMKTFMPEITIFDIMKYLYDGRDTKYGGGYCTTIHRRVFISRKLMEHNAIAEIRISDRYYEDEYDLLFDAWSNLVIEKPPVEDEIF